MTGQKLIVLGDVEGAYRRSGIDQDGFLWMEFEVDYFAGQEPGECCICGREIDRGWSCLDDGDEVCGHHVVFGEEEEWRL